MHIIDEEIDRICKDLQYIEDDLVRERTTTIKLCEHIYELKQKIRSLEKEKAQITDRYINKLKG
jgi:hypothetical protein